MDEEKRWLYALGRTVGDLRRALDLNQADLAQSAGVHTSQLSLIERGEVSTSVAIVLRLAKSLNLTPLELWQEVSQRVDEFGDFTEKPPARIGRPPRRPSRG